MDSEQNNGTNSTNNANWLVFNWKWNLFITFLIPAINVYLQFYVEIENRFIVNAMLLHQLFDMAT